MAEDAKNTNKKAKSKNVAQQNGGAGAVYGLGLIGAIVFYFNQADNFMMFVTGFLKAMVWPAFLVYKVLGL